jgi:hypothetical protein
MSRERKTWADPDSIFAAIASTGLSAEKVPQGVGAVGDVDVRLDKFYGAKASYIVVGPTGERRRGDVT